MMYLVVAAQALVVVWFIVYLSIVFGASRPVRRVAGAVDEIGQTLRTSTKWAFFFWYGLFFTLAAVQFSRTYF